MSAKFLKMYADGQVSIWNDAASDAGDFDMHSIGGTIYQRIGVVKEVEVTETAQPKVGDVVKDGMGAEWRVLTTDRPNNNYPIVAMRVSDGHIEGYSAHGKHTVGSSRPLDLIFTTTKTMVQYIPDPDAPVYTEAQVQALVNALRDVMPYAEACIGSSWRALPPSDSVITAAKNALAAFDGSKS